MIDTILELTKKLISIPSTPDNNEALGEIITLCKQELSGFTIEKFEDEEYPSLLIYNAQARPEKFKLILNAHLDVIEAEEYKLTQTEDRLLGRGVYDMKTAAATMIILFKKYAEKLPFPFALQLVTDEEVGGFHGTKYQIEQGVKADFVIAAEPTDLKINNEAKGILWAEIITHGISAHAAYPWNGKNAIIIMNEFIEKLLQKFPNPKNEEWVTTVNVASIKTENKTYNKIPDSCQANFDIRFVPQDQEKIKEKIKNLLPEGAEISYETEEAAHFTKEDNPFIQILNQSIERILNKKTEIIVKHGGSDIRHYNQNGMDGITFGLVGGGHHGEGEWVNIKSIESFSQILTDFLKNLPSLS